MDNQPTPPTEGSETQLQKANVARMNAYLDLDKLLNKAMEVSLAVTQAPLLAKALDGTTQTVPIQLHVAPQALSETLRAFVLEHKRLSIALDSLAFMLERAGVISKLELIKLETEAAEKTAVIVRRALLGAQAAGVDPKASAIIKPN